AQRWRNENYERPVDLEGSGDDDPFGEDELDDIYSGSGSGYFEPELGLDTAVSLTRDTLVTMPTTAAVLPATAAQPVPTPLEPSPTPQDTTPGQATGALPRPSTPRTAEPPERSTALPPTAATLPPTQAPQVGEAGAPLTCTGSMQSQEVATVMCHQDTQDVPPGYPGCATGISRMCHRGTQDVPAVPVSRQCLLQSSFPRQEGSRKGHPNIIPMSPTLSWVGDVLPAHTLPSLSPAPSSPFSQMEPGEVTAVPESELEVPASSGPSGDFEIREEEETTLPDLRNEVMAVVTVPAGPGPGRNVETGLLDNTIDSGNSAAQLPQKNILERKEVLIAVIVGGVVGALFAAFLVMLLIYRMKKKDEGSYTLEEPKQASVTYQKPDKQEEFYA
ncbi:SDC3 protein, partial [Aegithalos caudatus]|nr:SDC3 protein [Aegithalos caudatus]